VKSLESVAFCCSDFMRIHSFAKINLGLSVLGRRTDGYHEIQTVFQTISLSDELEFQPSDRLELSCENLPDTRKEENLIWKAAVSLAAKTSEKRGASIALRKKIPLGAGLGGGSSNAAATLLGLRRLWNVDLPDSDLRAIAATLGSDVPFFLSGGTAIGTGRGEEIELLPDFPAGHLVVIFPGIHVSTAEAYRSLNLGLTSPARAHTIQNLCGQARKGKSFLTEIFNDFEASVLPAYPPIMEAKRFLEERGAIIALLSGSGSSVFGFFSNEESAFAVSRAKARETWRLFPAKTLSRAEYFQNMFG
jgi:4-diphosphocytidyl-2-C-methyl-D-erythritol kinase